MNCVVENLSRDDKTDSMLCAFNKNI